MYRGVKLEIVILGQPRTKKNGSRIALINNKRVILPSKAFKAYEKVALVQLARVQAVHGPVSVLCRYYLQNRAHWPDLVGLLQATSDILQAAGVIDDDKYIVNYDGSKIAGIDKDRPRPRSLFSQLMKILSYSMSTHGKKLESATPLKSLNAVRLPRQGLRQNPKPLPQYRIRNTENS